MKPPKIDAEKLVKCLAEYGSLDRAIAEMEPELISSKAQLEELEEKRKTLQAEVAGLSKRKTILKKETNQMEKLKQALSKTIVTVRAEEKELKEYLPGLGDLVKTLEARKLDLEKRVGELDEMIKEREERLKVLAGTNEELEEKARLLKELEAKIAATGPRFQLFEGLLGFIRANTGAEMEVFLRTLPNVIAEAKRGKDDAEFLKIYVLQQLTFDTLKVAACRECGVEFMVVGRTRTERAESLSTYKTEPEYCPMCGRSWGLEHKIEIAQALVDELKPPAMGIVIVPRTPTPTDANFVPRGRTPTYVKLEKVEEGKTDKEAGK
jgi:DNA repair exonuclease SbcCD ATPase subunit